MPGGLRPGFGEVWDRRLLSGPGRCQRATGWFALPPVPRVDVQSLMIRGTDCKPI
jgi:hypothetical protein